METRRQLMGCLPSAQAQPSVVSLVCSCCSAQGEVEHSLISFLPHLIKPRTTFCGETRKKNAWVIDYANHRASCAGDKLFLLLFLRHECHCHLKKKERREDAKKKMSWRQPRVVNRWTARADKLCNAGKHPRQTDTHAPSQTRAKRGLLLIYCFRFGEDV